MPRLLLIRLDAGSDLVTGIEGLARQHRLFHALVRGGPGSLMHARLQAGGPAIDVPGPAAEILTMVGEIHDGVADLHGAVGDPEGRIYAGRFVRNENPVCVTVELVVEEIAAPSDEIGQRQAL